MADELRILFLEDSHEDVELEEHELRKGGLVFASVRVESQEDFIRAIKDFNPDLIISDYTLPEMDGSTALRAAREIAPDVPFLFVSGTIGEERAVQSLKDGATDYLVKDRLNGLVFAVNRALKEAKERAEHRRLEEQFRQAQKMEAIGRLAGGIAHDVNNMLCVVNGYSELVLKEMGVDNPQRPSIEEILRAGQRTATLTRQLLAFSRRQIISPVVLDLNSIVSEVDKMLRRLIGEDVTLVIQLEASLGKVKADPGQIEQVLVNLAVNARDAMPNGGRLTIETANVELNETYVREHAGAKSGLYVMLAASDTGVGMDAEVQSHLFEPFFTTKEPGKGTGLGLSTVYGIVKQSGGYIEVSSEPGQGAAFKVYLPRSGKSEKESTRHLNVSPRPTTHGTETILLVEDAEPVRKLIQNALRANGYNVLVAGTGEEAFRVSKEHEGPIHLLLTDIVMPEISGREVAHRLAPSRPETRVLYTSGYADGDIVTDGILEAGIAFLQKPFGAQDLVRKVREVLDATQEG